MRDVYVWPNIREIKAFYFLGKWRSWTWIPRDSTFLLQHAEMLRSAGPLTEADVSEALREDLEEKKNGEDGQQYMLFSEKKKNGNKTT